MRITREVLEYTGACRDQMKKYLNLWPDGLEITIENIALVQENDIQIWLPGANLHEADLRGADLPETGDVHDRIL